MWYIELELGREDINICAAIPVVHVRIVCTISVLSEENLKNEQHDDSGLPWSFLGHAIRG